MSDAYAPGGSSNDEVRYKVAGEAQALFSRGDLRNRIREGTIQSETEIAPEGTDDYRPARAFPELQRYFSLVSSQAVAASSSSLVPAQHSAPPASVASRLIPGALYPFTGFGAAFVIVLAMFELLPLFSIISAFAIPVFSVVIIRVSSEGGTRMPPLAAFGGFAGIVMTALKALAIAILTAWPVILAIIATLISPRGAMGFIMMAIVAMLLYYPACLAILAKFNTIRPALSVTQVWNFITTLGSDYAVALCAGFAVVGVAVILGMAAAFAGLPERLQVLVVMIPIVWGTFYIAHLIGWAMYNRRAQL